MRALPLRAAAHEPFRSLAFRARGAFASTASFQPRLRALPLRAAAHEPFRSLAFRARGAFASTASFQPRLRAIQASSDGHFRAHSIDAICE
jgi:hypothetical protein